jgi:hypothetical protein
MRIINKAVTCSWLMLGAFGVVQCQGWRGIVPLHSNCEDVKRAIGITECETKTYDLKDAMVSINFADGTCLSGWKVPPGTVLTLDIHPKPSLSVVDLQIEQSTYNRVEDQHVQGVVHYKNDEKGISVAVFDNGTVAYLFYGPSLKDEKMRCQTDSGNQEPSDAGAFGSVKFDEYSEISAKAEHERLDNFAVQLKAQRTTQGYIIAYGGRRSWHGEAKDRAACARIYLIKKHGIDSHRLVTVDGGYQEKPVVALYIRLRSGNPPAAFPTVDPSEIRFRRERRYRKNNRLSSQLGCH